MTRLAAVSSHLRSCGPFSFGFFLRRVGGFLEFIAEWVLIGQLFGFYSSCCILRAGELELWSGKPGLCVIFGHNLRMGAGRQFIYLRVFVIRSCQCERLDFFFACAIPSVQSYDPWAQTSRLH
jgi:hypothetical protein